jgi:hypothetical protein
MPDAPTPPTTPAATPPSTTPQPPAKTSLSLAWAALVEAFTWLKDHLGVIATVLGAAVLYSATIGRRGVSPADKLAVELDAVSAKAQTAQIVAQQGADAAHAHIQQTYAAQLTALNQEQLLNATQLHTDPPALAAYLVRVGTGLSKGK